MITTTKTLGPALLLMGLLAASCSAPQAVPQRYGMMIGLEPEMVERYRELQADPWPAVLEKLAECNLRNYSVYLAEPEPGRYYLFSYFEYVGSDFDADMEALAADAETQRWWKEADPCQFPVPAAGEESWWYGLEEVFHCD